MKDIYDLTLVTGATGLRNALTYYPLEGRLDVIWEQDGQSKPFRTIDLRAFNPIEIVSSEHGHDLHIHSWQTQSLFIFSPADGYVIEYDDAANILTAKTEMPGKGNYTFKPHGKDK